MISVIVPTNRIGGLDLLFDSLEKQTYRDFELVLVDNLWKYREALVKAKASEYGFDVQHVEPRDNPFPAAAYCRSMNTGIEYAQGDVLVYQCDYSWLSPDCLERHADFQARKGRPLMLDYSYVELPELALGFKRFSPGIPAEDPKYHERLSEVTELYRRSLFSGALEDFMWSIFTDAITDPSKLKTTLRHWKHAYESEGPDHNYCSFKNESFPTEMILDLNGHDEAYDESHCYQDSELSYRLRESKIEWSSGPRGAGMVYVADPRPVLHVKRMGRPIEHNRKLCFEDRAASKKLRVNPGFDLRGRRDDRLSTSD